MFLLRVLQTAVLSPVGDCHIYMLVVALDFLPRDVSKNNQILTSCTLKFEMPELNSNS